MTTTESTETIHVNHAFNRARKASRIARTVIDAGVSAQNPQTMALLDSEGFREMALRATPTGLGKTSRARASGRRRDEFYVAAEPETWDEVVAIVVSLTEAR